MWKALRGRAKVCQLVSRLGGIDEQAVRYDYDPYNESIVLIDANYNVTGLTTIGNWQRQYSYEPYGDLFAAEKNSSGTVTSVSLTDPSAVSKKVLQHFSSPPYQGGAGGGFF